MSTAQLQATRVLTRRRPCNAASLVVDYRAIIYIYFIFLLFKHQSGPDVARSRTTQRGPRCAEVESGEISDTDIITSRDGALFLAVERKNKELSPRLSNTNEQID